MFINFTMRTLTTRLTQNLVSTTPLPLLACTPMLIPTFTRTPIRRRPTP